MCVSSQKHAKGQDLLKRVCEHLNLLEEDYFGLAVWEGTTSKVRRLQCKLLADSPSHVGDSVYTCLSGHPCT